MINPETASNTHHAGLMVASRAEFIVNNLQETHYTHTQHISVDSGVYDCDCAEFVGFVLQEVVPKLYAMIPKEANRLRPRAFEYYEFLTSPTLKSKGGWREIKVLSDLQRGDIVAWKFPEIKAKHDTGHVFFVAEKPVTIDLNIFAVRVYDSAAVPHFEDTRSDGDSGVGSGFISFKINDEGSPVAFQFGPIEDKFVTLPIAMGRLEPLL